MFLSVGIKIKENKCNGEWDKEEGIVWLIGLESTFLNVDGQFHVGVTMVTTPMSTWSGDWKFGMLF